MGRGLLGKFLKGSSEAAIPLALDRYKSEQELKRAETLERIKAEQKKIEPVLDDGGTPIAQRVVGTGEIKKHPLAPAKVTPSSTAKEYSELQGAIKEGDFGLAKTLINTLERKQYGQEDPMVRASRLRDHYKEAGTQEMAQVFQGVLDEKKPFSAGGARDYRLLSPDETQGLIESQGGTYVPGTMMIEKKDGLRIFFDPAAGKDKTDLMIEVLTPIYGEDIAKQFASGAKELNVTSEGQVLFTDMTAFNSGGNVVTPIRTPLPKEVIRGRPEGGSEGNTQDFAGSDAEMPVTPKNQTVFADVAYVSGVWNQFSGILGSVPGGKPSPREARILNAQTKANNLVLSLKGSLSENSRNAITEMTWIGDAMKLGPKWWDNPIAYGVRARSVGNILSQKILELNYEYEKNPGSKRASEITNDIFAIRRALNQLGAPSSGDLFRAMKPSDVEKMSKDEVSLLLGITTEEEFQSISDELHNAIERKTR